MRIPDGAAAGCQPTGSPRAGSPRAASPQSRSPWAAGLTAVLAVVTILAAGCGSTHAAAPAPAGARAATGRSLVTSLTASGGTSWAVVEMGGSSAKHDNFWQLMARPAGAARWVLATPLGVAANGGIVAASPGGRGLVAGFNPSQDLTFSPLATTRDGGARWTPSLLPAGLARVPSALAAGPGGKLIALTSSGQVKLSAPGVSGWTTPATRASLAATPAGHSCGLAGLTAAAFGPSGAVLLAGGCARPGVAGIFGETGGRWQLAGPMLPAALGRQHVSVLQLAPAGRGTIALLTATAAGGASSLIAAWEGADSRWTLSAPLPMDGARIRSTATGATAHAGVILSTGRAEVITGPGARWEALPALPAHAAALVLGPGRQVSALAPAGSVLTSWRLAARAGTWDRTQVLKVPVPYGSSG